MNRFEKAVHECMDPVEALLQKTSNPLHRAMLENFRRHVHLEGSGQFDRIVASDMTVEHPVYRVAWGDNPVVVEGRQNVVDFYNSVGEQVLWNSDDCIAVGDWGIADELTFHQLLRGSDLRRMGYEADDADAIYHLSSRQAFIWPYDEKARLRGENLYEDKTSVQVEKIDPSEAITPARVRDIHLARLAELDGKGEGYWTLEAQMR